MAFQRFCPMVGGNPAAVITIWHFRLQPPFLCQEPKLPMLVLSTNTSICLKQHCSSTICMTNPASYSILKDEIPGTLYGLSLKGWMGQELFDLWMDHFPHYAPPARLLLLLMDGHLLHYCPSAIHIASQHQVVLLALPPNTTVSIPLIETRLCHRPYISSFAHAYSWP